MENQALTTIDGQDAGRIIEADGVMIILIRDRVLIAELTREVDGQVIPTTRAEQLTYVDFCKAVRAGVWPQTPTRAPARAAIPTTPPPTGAG